MPANETPSKFTVGLAAVASVLVAMAIYAMACGSDTRARCPEGCGFDANGSCTVVVVEGTNCGGVATGCQGDTDCPDPGASYCNPEGACVPCTESAQCGHIAGQNVCSAGACVECAAEAETACGSNVCDLATSTCSNVAAASLEDCAPCKSSRACRDGSSCAQMQFIDASDPQGFFCLPTQAAQTNQACINARPYGDAETLPTIEGVPEGICTLSLTTCDALADFRTRDCKANGIAENLLCGLEEFDDAYCIPFAAGGPEAFRCSTRCTTVDDCPDGSSSCAGATGVPTGRKVCSL